MRQEQSPRPQPPPGNDWPGYPPYGGAGLTHSLYGDPPRPLVKTWLVSTLLMFIPVIGIGLAVTYIYTRNRPGDFDPVQGALTGVVLLINVIVVVLIVYAIAVLIGAVFGVS